MRISEAAAYLGVSDDTVRRWVDQGALSADLDAAGRKVLDGLDVARAARANADHPQLHSGTVTSARNRLTGIVTEIRMDAVMAQVEVQCGPFRMVSLMSSEAVTELGLEPGSIAVAVIKSTNVIVETLEGES